jgi:hypothetical protein
VELGDIGRQDITGYAQICAVSLEKNTLKIAPANDLIERFPGMLFVGVLPMSLSKNKKCNLLREIRWAACGRSA